MSFEEITRKENLLKSLVDVTQFLFDKNESSKDQYNCVHEKFEQANED